MKKRYDKPFTIDGNKLTVSEDGKRFYITFKDYLGNEITSEIPKEIYRTYKNAYLNNFKMKYEERKHWDADEQTEESIYEKSFEQQKSLEEIVIENEEKENIKITITRIPELQSRRIKMRYFKEMTLKDISKIEDCSIVAVKYSLDNAEKNQTNFKEIL